MKVHKEKEGFSPVVITLESQEEVDQLYTIVNYNPITEASPMARELWRLLGDYYWNYGKYWNDFVSKLEKRIKGMR